jgi:alpha-D-xyloside xylohydrolase
VDDYLPPGRWTNLLSGETVEGGRWQRERHGYLSLPLMVRPNTVLSVGANENQPDYDYADDVVYHVFELDEGAVATAHVPGLDGQIEVTVEARRTGSRIGISVQGSTGPWSVLLRGVEDVVSVEGCAAQAETLGTRLVPAEDVRRLAVHL